MLEVSTLKALVGVQATDTSQDAVLAFILADVQEIICNYCNINKVPAGLTNTAYRMAADMYKLEGFGGGSAGGSGVTGAVTQITEGGDSVSFASTESLSSAYATSLVKSYSAQLARYRRLAW